MPSCPEESGGGHPLLRAVAFVGALLAIAVLLSLLAAPILDRLGFADVQAALGDTRVLLAAAAVSSLLMLLVTFLFMRGWDRCPWGHLFAPGPGVAAPPAGRGLLTGSLLAAAVLLLLLGVLYAAGWLVIDGWGALGRRGLSGGLCMLVIYAVVFFLQGGAEEVVFRGYLFRNLGLWGGRPAALLGNAVVFACAHGLNPGNGPLSLLNTFLLGVLLGLVRLRTRLWTAIGFHAGWNFALALLAVPVSGLELEGLLATRVHGPALWTGGGYGIEASLLTTLIAVAACGAFYFDKRH